MGCWRSSSIKRVQRRVSGGRGSPHRDCCLPCRRGEQLRLKVKQGDHQRRSRRLTRATEPGQQDTEGKQLQREWLFRRHRGSHGDHTRGTARRALPFLSRIGLSHRTPISRHASPRTARRQPTLFLLLLLRLSSPCSSGNLRESLVNTPAPALPTVL